MKLSLLSAFSTLVVMSGLAGCSGDDDTDGTGGTSGSGGTGQAGTGTGGTGTGGTGTGGTGTAGAGTGGTGTAGSGTGGSTGGSGGTAGSTAGSAGSASGGGGAGGGAAGGASDAPSDTTQAGIEAFLAAKEYRDAGWVADVPAAREASESISPHGRVQVWFNGTLRQGKEMSPRPSGSMVVKELYDAGTNVVGHAVMLRTMATTNQWIYYCIANEDGRCASGSMANTPSYSQGTGACSCHGGGTVITPIPVP